MTTFHRFERNLPDLLEALAAPQLPDYADELFARTAATRQRPGWTFPERWLPMSALTRRFAPMPRIPWRLGVLVALLAIAALATALIAGSLLNPRPAPYGPAANGQIVYVDSTGRIILGDIAAGTSHIVVADPGNQLPTFSQDGTRLAFARTTGGMVDLYVAGADGSNARKITTEPISGPSYLGWSGRGDRLLATDAGGKLLLFDASRAGPPTILSDGLGLGGVAVGPGYNTFQSNTAFRPPNGEEILFVAGAGSSIRAIRPDGTNLRTLVDTSTDLKGAKFKAAQWSPDGSQVLLLVDHRVNLSGDQERWHAYVVNADGSDLRPLSPLSEDFYTDTNSPTWSPDGSRVAFQYWTVHPDGSGQDFHAIGIVDVATGVLTEVGPVQLNGFTSWEWSPDGQSILMVPGSGDILVVNARTGDSVKTPWNVGQPIDWQRVAK